MEADHTSDGDSAVSLGSRLRAERAAAKLSVRELARRVGKSPSFVSQVELGRATPSIGTLYSIVSELGLSLDDVMKTDGSPPPVAPTASVTQLVPQEALTVPIGAHLDRIRAASGPQISQTPDRRSSAMDGAVQRADERPTIAVGGVTWERLTGQDDPEVDFLRIVYAPHTESCPINDLQRHPGWEYGHVLSGTLDVQVMFETTNLHVGDSINFASTTPHRLSNPYDEPCVAMWVVVGRNNRT